MNQLKSKITILEGSSFKYDQGLLNGGESHLVDFEKITGEDLLKIIDFCSKGDFEMEELKEGFINPNNPNHLIYKNVYDKINEFDREEFTKGIDIKINTFVDNLNDNEEKQ